MLFENIGNLIFRNLRLSMNDNTFLVSLENRLSLQYCLTSHGFHMMSFVILIVRYLLVFHILYYFVFYLTYFFIIHIIDNTIT